MEIKVHSRVKEYFRSLPDKSRRIAREYMDRLYQYPHVNADIECIRKYPGSQLWRMHIARSFTMFYTVIPAIEEIHIDDLMTVEQAYKKYRQ